MRDQSAITTYHEAGHVVMAMANGFTVTRMSNVASDVGRGFVEWQSPQPPTTASRVGSVLVLSAGIAADYIHWNQNGAAADEVIKGHNDDRRQAEIHLDAIGQSGEFETYVGMSTHFLRRPVVWQWVDDFAALMTAAGTIDGRELLYRASQKVPRFEAADLDLLARAIKANKGRPF